MNRRDVLPWHLYSHYRVGWGLSHNWEVTNSTKIVLLHQETVSLFPSSSDVQEARAAHRRHYRRSEYLEFLPLSLWRTSIWTKSVRWLHPNFLNIFPIIWSVPPFPYSTIIILVVNYYFYGWFTQQIGTPKPRISTPQVCHPFWHWFRLWGYMLFPISLSRCI